MDWIRGQQNAWRVGAIAAACLIVFALACMHQQRPDLSPSPVRVPETEQPAEESISENSDIAGYCTSLRNSSDPFFGTQQRERLTGELEDPSFPTLSWRTSIMRELARDHLRFGEASEAIELLEEALDDELRENPEVSHEEELLEELAIASLKMGELDNCVSPDGRLICVLPLDSSVAHEDERGARGAVGYLVRLLELEPEDTRVSRRAIWLLNVAHMALGSYPEGVQDEYRIPPESFEATFDTGRFKEIAPYAGLYAVNTAGGSIIEDFDNDGLLDVVTSTWDPCKPITYYRNEGEGTFEDVTAKAGLSGQLGGLNITQTDYDHDGWMDILVMRGGWMKMRGQMRMSLLRNNGGAGGAATFSDVTEAVGLAKPAYPSQSATWADYDNDGDLDLFSCNESMREAGTESTALLFPSQLFRNNGNGQFEDVAQDAGVQNWRYCKGSAWGDYDNDGYPDLYISNFGDANRLYRNNGDGTFSDVSPELGLTSPTDSFATWFWDYDNDGWLDIFVAGYGEDIEDVAADYLGLENDGARPRLYRNLGGEGLEDVTRETGLWRVHLAMGANFGDFDNDGYLDLLLGTGAPSYDAIAPNVAYRNDSGETFQDVTFSGGFGHLQKGHGVSFGDLDRDGDQDIFMQVGGFFPGDGFVNALYTNPGHGNRWLSIKLVGTESNRAAIGAQIEVKVVDGDGSSRSVHSTVSNGSSFGSSTLTQEIGLGQVQSVVSLEVYWPMSGVRQTFDDVPLDRHLRIVEGDDSYEVLDLAPLPLGIGQ